MEIQVETATAYWGSYCDPRLTCYCLGGGERSKSLRYWPIGAMLYHVSLTEQTCFVFK